MTFHVPNQYRVRVGQFGTDDSNGNHGLFIGIGPFSRALRMLSSDGMGWEHVSVSLERSMPGWQEMCWVKSLFWDEEDVVMQLHPKQSEYVNFHPYCLHLWRPTGAEIPTPPSLLVGPKLSKS